MIRALTVLALLSSGCAAFSPRGEFWTSERWGKCAALVVSVGGSVDLSAHACARVNNPSPDGGTADATGD